MRAAGLTPTHARIAYAACGVASIVASVSGSVVNRIGLRTSYLAACLLLAAAQALIAVAPGHVVLAMLAAVLFGAFYCAVIATQGIWSAEVFAERPSAGLSAVNTALTIGTIAGPAAAGVAIHRAGYTATLLAAAAVVAVAIFFCPPTARRREILAAHSEVCRAKPAKG